MFDYLSDDWLLAMNDALERHVWARPIEGDTPLVVQNTVTESPQGEIRYGVVLSRAGCRIEAGPHPRADVSFTCDFDTAIAIATGSQSAQVAFMAGRLRIGGDARQLMANQHLLAEVDDVFAIVRANTSFRSAL